MQRHAISAAFKLCGHAILENKTANFSSKAILENKIAKILKIVQPRKLRASKICTYTVVVSCGSLDDYDDKWT